MWLPEPFFLAFDELLSCMELGVAILSSSAIILPLHYSACPFFLFLSLKKKKNNLFFEVICTPSMGFKLATLRSGVLFSTDWASWAPHPHPQLIPLTLCCLGIFSCLKGKSNVVPFSLESWLTNPGYHGTSLISSKYFS